MLFSSVDYKYFFLKKKSQYIYKIFFGNFYILRINIHAYFLDIFILNYTLLLDFLFILYYHINLQLKLLIDIVVTDTLRYNKRFQITYIFLSLVFNFRIHLSLFLSEFNVKLNSIFFLYASANWLEREVWEMFGIFFYNHIDLRRLLTEYGFYGFPLRKDFPLSGYTEAVYCVKYKNVIHQKISLSQEYRYYFFE